MDFCLFQGTMTQKVENIVLIPRICVQLIHRKSGLSISQKLVSVLQGVAHEISPACLCRLLKYPFSFGYLRSSDKRECLRSQILSVLKLRWHCFPLCHFSAIKNNVSFKMFVICFKNIKDSDILQKYHFSRGICVKNTSRFCECFSMEKHFCSGLATLFKC